jgi:hypothetical protein
MGIYVFNLATHLGTVPRLAVPAASEAEATARVQADCRRRGEQVLALTLLGVFGRRRADPHTDASYD